MSRHEIRLSPGAAERVDRLLAAALVGFSRRIIQQLLGEGRITIDGRIVRKGDVFRGERTLDVEVLAAAGLPPEPDLPVPILFEDPSCVAIDKPAGRPANALRAGERGTVANFLVARFPECAQAGSSPLEAGLVHRLDVETSGVLLCARTHEAWLALRKQFLERKVDKLYLALVHGSISSAGEIVRPIASADRRKVRVLDGAEASPERAQPAITRYQPRSQIGDVTLLDVEIPTGVRHQIRAHLAAVGHPVIGDRLYGPPSTEKRQLLHAARLAFDHPATGERVIVASAPPDDFMGALRNFGFSTPPV